MAQQRRRSAATAAEAARPPPLTGLLSLPDDALLRCLGLLDQEERLGPVALTCKRLKALSMSPGLLSRVGFGAWYAEGAVPRLGALLRFLSAHGEQHVHELYIMTRNINRLPASQQQEAMALAGACAAACGGPASALTRLDVSSYSAPLPSTPWLRGLTALRELRLVSPGHRLRLSSDLRHLGCLTRLYLGGAPLEMGACARLPAGLLELDLYDCCNSDQLPSQVSALDALSSVIIAHSDYSSAGTDALASLASLRRLRIMYTALPRCLSALAALEQLTVYVESAGDLPALEAALARLTGLTALVVQGCQRVPASLGSLSRLQRLSLQGWFQPGCGHSLPPGPWLASIRWLGADWGLLEASAAGVLAAAPRLEYLCSHGLPALSAGRGPAWRAFWRFVASHPPLLCFGMEPNGTRRVSGATAVADSEEDEDGEDEEDEAEDEDEEEMANVAVIMELEELSAHLLRALLTLRTERPALRLCYQGRTFIHRIWDSGSVPPDDPPAF